MSDLFNLWAAICAAAGRITLPLSKPNWNQLTATVDLITKIEKRKLTLTYHPDKLMHVLGRSPTPEEIKMSTIAMSALNLLFSEGYLREQKSIMATMSELDTLNKESKKKEPKPPKEPAQKRKPTAYNNFVKITIPIIKAESVNTTVGKGYYMGQAAARWKALSKEEQVSYA